ncbi:hypothetical protein F442_22560, partial [Phytophthora nicotianae P10297]
MYTVLENPLLSVWARYLDAFNVKYPDKKTTIMEILTRKLGDKKMASMLSAATTKATTTNIATRLESDL